jgi:hypothetical protein
MKLHCITTQMFVIPAKAGIQHLHSMFKQTVQVMDPRLRGGDEVLPIEGAVL